CDDSPVRRFAGATIRRCDDSPVRRFDSFFRTDDSEKKK
ncbi:MAG: hypothetical protein ACJA0X_001771, partial [Cyclobacteriaceae bacterium]